MLNRPAGRFALVMSMALVLAWGAVPTSASEVEPPGAAREPRVAPGPAPPTRRGDAGARAAVRAGPRERGDQGVRAGS